MTKQELYKASGVGSYFDRSYRSFVAIFPIKLQEDIGKYQTTMAKVLWDKEDRLEDIVSRINAKKAEAVHV
jgi:hypothetical protein